MSASRDSSVGVATRYGQDGPAIEFWAGGARFTAPIQTGQEARPGSCTMDTESLTRRQSGRSVTLTTHPHLEPRLKKEQSYTSTPPQEIHCLFQVELKIANDTAFTGKKKKRKKSTISSLLHYGVAQCLRRCTTSRTVPGSIPVGVTGFFSDIFLSEQTMALGSTQPLVKMSTWG